MHSSQRLSDEPEQQTKPSQQMVVIHNLSAMDEAIAAAQKTLPDYLAFYAAGVPKHTHSHRVKAMFTDGPNSEHIWLLDFKQNGNFVVGVVSNIPELVSTVENGQIVNVPVASLTDWAFECGSRQFGNYTVYAMFQEMQEELVNYYVEKYGFNQNPLDSNGSSFAQLIQDLPTAQTPKAPNPPKSTVDQKQTSAAFDAEINYRVEAVLANETDFSHENIRRIVSRCAMDLYTEVVQPQDDGFEAAQFAVAYLQNVWEERQ